MNDPVQIMESIAKRHPNMRLSTALREVKHELRREAVLAELRAPRSALAECAPSATQRIAANLRKIADRMEGNAQ